MDKDNINELPEDNAQEQDNLLHDAINAKMKQLQMGSLLQGSKAICHVILGYIAEFMTTPGKKSFRQQEKLIKRIRHALPPYSIPLRSN